MNSIKLKKIWKFGRSGTKTHFYNFSTTKHYSFEDPSGKIFFALSLIKNKTNKIKLISELNNKFSGNSLYFIQDFIKTLKIMDALENNGILLTKKSYKKYFSSSYVLGLDRQIEFFKEIFPNKNPFLIQKKIKDTNIALLGLGTVAQNIIPSLVASGAGSYTCVDFDIVEKRNLGRQLLFKPEDIGKKKTAVVASYIKKLKPGAKIKIVNEELKSERQIKRIIKNCDIVIHCCDSPKFIIHEIINNACLSLRKPSLVATPGKLGPFVLPGISACYECLELHMLKKFPGYNEIKDIIKKEEDTRFPGLAIIVSITGVLAAKEVLSYILGFKPETINGILRISPQNLVIQRIPVKRNSACSACKNIK